MKVSTFGFIVCAVLVLCCSLADSVHASSPVVSAELRWKDAPNSSPPYNATSPEEGCKDIEVGNFYQGWKFDKFIPGQPNSYGTVMSGTCKDTDGDTFAVISRCRKVKADGSVSYSYWRCPPPPLLSCPVDVGNPTDVLTGIKSEYATDWTSSKDGRFRLQRNYRSNIDHLRTLIPGTSYSGAPEFAGLWRFEFAEVVAWDWDYERYVYMPSNGQRIHFDYDRDGSGNGVPEQVGHSYSLNRINRHNIWIESGDGRRDYYKHRRRGSLKFNTEHFQLKRVQFSDGYEIEITHTSPGRVKSLKDNKGQYASFTYVNNAVSNSSELMLKYVDIDVDYNGSTLDADYRIEYLYDPNSFFADVPLLAEVRFTDIAANTTETTTKYVYDANTYPPLLTNIKDGRLDDTGSEFNYSMFAYHDPKQANQAEVSSSEHFGGADGYTFGVNDGTTSSATNALGRTTNYTIAEISDRLRLAQLDGVATTNCLPAGKSFDYTPGTGEPEGYLYSKVEKNGSVTNYTRNARGLVLTKTEDANGTSPRVTTYTWHSTLRLPLTRSTSEMIETFTYNVTTDGEVQLATYSQIDNYRRQPQLWPDPHMDL